MNTRNFILLLVLLSALTSFADKKMTICNDDTGESFEVSVPNGLKIHEYNSNWLDSIPYLVEHARWKKTWAYEALAECYRYGKGGVEKSMFNAIMSYEEAGMSATKVAEKAYESNPSDEFGMINHIMEELNKKSLSEEQVISMIDNIPSPVPSWVSFLKKILQNSSVDRKIFIESRLSNETTPDEFLVGFGLIAMSEKDAFNKKFVGITDDYMHNLRVYGEKLPPIYDVAGEKLWEKYFRENEKDEQYLVNALECMYRADQAGFLSKGNMTRVLTYCEQNGRNEHILFSDEDLVRFDKICPKEYRNHVMSAVVVEEVVEMDECPVELIEE